MNKKTKKLFMLSLLLLQFDQLSKIFIRCNYPFSNLKEIPLKGQELIHNFFYITKVENTGAAWGNFSGNIVFLSIVSVFVFFMLFNYAIKEKLSNYKIIYYSMLFAGILGNLIDRVFFVFVTDFLNFYIFSYDYPVFNVADIFIVVGVLLYIIDIARGEWV